MCEFFHLTMGKDWILFANTFLYSGMREFLFSANFHFFFQNLCNFFYFQSIFVLFPQFYTVFQHFSVLFFFPCFWPLGHIPGIATWIFTTYNKTTSLKQINYSRISLSQDSYMVEPRYKELWYNNVVLLQYFILAKSWNFSFFIYSFLQAWYSILI